MSSAHSEQLSSFSGKSVDIVKTYVDSAIKERLKQHSGNSLSKTMRAIRNLLSPQREALNPYFQAEIEHAAQKLIEGMIRYTALAMEVDKVVQTPNHSREQVFQIEGDRHALHLQLVRLATTLAITQDELNTLIQLQLEDALSQKVSNELSAKMSQCIGLTVSVEDDDLQYSAGTARERKSEMVRLAREDEKPSTYSLSVRVVYRPRDNGYIPFKASLVDDEPVFSNILFTEINQFFSQFSINYPQFQAQFRQFRSHYCHDYEYFPGDDAMALQLLTIKLTFPKNRLLEIEKIFKESSPFISRKL